MDRILVYRWKVYHYADVIDAFLQEGYEVDELWHTMDSYDADDKMAELLRQRLKGCSYEFVFSINYFPVISDVCSEIGIRYVCWTCDSPLIAMYHDSVFHSVNRIFTFDKTNEIEFRRMGVENIFYLPLGAPVERLDGLLKTPPSMSLDYYRNEVSFVGSLYEKNSYDRLSGKLPEFLQGYFEAVMEIQSRQYGVSHVVDAAMSQDVLEQLQEKLYLEKSDRSFSDVDLVFSVTALGYKTAQIQRIRDLLALAKQNRVSIYSGSNAMDLYPVEYKGSVEYGTQMPYVFSNSKVNLNFTIPNIKSGIPLRVWDVMGCGGFLLTNAQAELSYYFENEKHLVWFTSQEELLEKASYYTRPVNDSKREAIARAGYELVKKEHTLHKRVKKMLALALH
jgi:spore maturation protein CgeB